MLGDKGLALIQQFEGLRLTAYPDPGTGGDPWTIGIGHTGGVQEGDTCTQAEADEWFAEDYETALEGAKRVAEDSLIDWTTLALPRWAVLCDMAYEMGMRRLGGFHYMLAAIKAGDWAEAKEEALASAWAKEVPVRAAMNANMLLTGEWPS